MQSPIDLNSIESPLLGSIYKFNPNTSILVSNNNFNTQYFYYNLNTSLFNQSLFINDVYQNTYIDSNKRADFTRVIGISDDNIDTEIDAQLPLFFINKNLIKVPNKIAYALSRYTPKELLDDIHKDTNVAIEMCLIFTTQLTSTYFEMKSDSKSNGWKSLKAEYLRELLSSNPLTYKKVVTALEYPLAKGQILECDHKHIKGEKSFNYRLGVAYIGRGIVSYELKTKEAQGLLNKHYFRMLSSSNQSVICKNLIRVYSDIKLPTIDQITKEAKRLIRLKYETKKGKKLTFLNRHPRNYYKNADNRSFVEDSIEIYNYLTDNGLMIPVAGGDKSGGRVVDSFTLMPSWIRRLVKYKGRTLIECDYTALHPNIAIKLYGGDTAFITHGDLANDLKLDVKTIKVEHLSFFNKKVVEMKQSPLYEYYLEHEPKMLENITSEKYSSQHGHKITSRRMFGSEVDIMTDVIRQLNIEGVYVLYVYDALLCSRRDAERVANVMDSVILTHGVKTKAKVSSGNKYNPIVAILKETKIDTNIFKMSPSMPETHNDNTTKGIAIDNIITVSSDEINFNLRIKDSILQRINAGENLVFIDALIKFSDGDTIRDKILRIHDPINFNLKYITQSFILDQQEASIF